MKYDELFSSLHSTFDNMINKEKEEFFTNEITKRGLENTYVYVLYSTALKGYGIRQYNVVEKIKLIDAIKRECYKMYDSLEDARKAALEDIDEDIENLKHKLEFSEENKKIVEGWTDD